MQRPRAIARLGIASAVAVYINCSWQRSRRSALPHRLPSRLSVTLTSYPPRFANLALTLKSLLAQDLRPDFLYLWIAQRDVAALPDDVTNLQTAGLIIRCCEDLRSYKKIVPALHDAADDFFVIADDDVYYRRGWLREIVSAYRKGSREVLCGRAHQIRLNERGSPLPYAQWNGSIAQGSASRLTFPTGVGGVLYEPGIFHRDVTRADIFGKLCPTADDIWLFWMAALNGARFRKVGRRRRTITWPDSQNVGLHNTNYIANDAQITNMISRYGMPWIRND